MKIRRSLKLFYVILFGLCILFSSCHTPRDSARWEDPIYAKKGSGRIHTADNKKEESKGNYSRPEVKTGKKEKDVIDAACSWIGTPYRYGGNTQKGVDCSGLVCMAFETGAGIKLPRTSSDMAGYCKKISKERAKPGDLIFFTSKSGGNRINHVALYLGQNKIVHATTTLGVIISSLEDDYWKTHFHSCGRVF